MLSAMIPHDILIIGGGAAGLTAACTAGKHLRGAQTITIIEGNSRVGRKILSTGNGRCNLTNTDLSLSHFHSRSPQMAERIVQKRSLADTLDFFSQLGLRVSVEDGRVYPYSQSASAVLDTLRLETERLRIRTVTDTRVRSVTYDAGAKRFTVAAVRENRQETWLFKKVIVATGGMAAPDTGSNGSGFDILAGLGHAIEKPYPVLTPLILSHTALKHLKGIRVKPCRLTLSANGRVLADDKGEVLFTDYGLSGIPAMQVSGAANGHENITAHLDFVPDMSETEVLDYLRERRALLPQRTSENFFAGWLHKRVGEMIIRYAVDIPPLRGDTKKSAGLSAVTLTDASLVKMAALLKNWSLPVTGVKSFSSAQATGGGASLAEFCPETLMSRIIPGLYAAGEVLDVYGDCGGYNLHWAWTTGYLSGSGAAEI